MQLQPSAVQVSAPPSTNDSGSPRFLSVAQAADLLGTSEVTLYRAIHSQQFPAIKIRGRYVIPGRALDAMEEAALAGTVVNSAAWVVVER